MKNCFFILLCAITTHLDCSEQSSQIKDWGLYDESLRPTVFTPTQESQHITLNIDSKEQLFRQLERNETLENLLHYATLQTAQEKSFSIKNATIKNYENFKTLTYGLRDKENSDISFIKYTFNSFSNNALLTVDRRWPLLFNLKLHDHPTAAFTLGDHQAQDNEFCLALALTICKALKVKTLRHMPEKGNEPLALLEQHGFKQIDGKLALDLNQ